MKITFTNTTGGIEVEEACTPKDKTFRILSIDGGGIKGLYSLSVLNVFEKHFNIKIRDCFDMICGTSTGGLIALALSIGKSTDELIAIYKENASIIFPHAKNFAKVRGLIKQICKGKYENIGLCEVLDRLFEDKKMKDAKTNLCIPTTNLTGAVPVVFKKGHCPEHTRDPEISMKDVALATTAAPTFLPIAKIDALAHDFIDGGLWANDPSLVGLIEAINIFVGEDKEYKNIELLSIASVSAQVGKMVQKNHQNSYLSWCGGKDLIDLIMQLQTKATQNYINHLCQGLPYIKCTRISEPDLSVVQAKNINLDSINQDELKTLESLGNMIGYEWVKEINIKELFTQKVTK